MHGDSDDERGDEDVFTQMKPLRQMGRDRKVGDRWPYEPPAPEQGPDGGVREPRRPSPDAGGGAAVIQPAPTDH